MRKTIGFSVVFFLTVAALLLAFVWSGSSGNNTSDSNENAASVSVTPRPDCAFDTLAGVTLDCLGGEVTPTGDNAQRTVVSLWAWWCEPCRTELPFFDELAARHPELTVIGVHQDPDSARGAALLDDLGVQMASLSDPNNQLSPRLNLPNVVPITLVFAADGELERFYAIPFESYEELEATVQ
ncbi:MAG: TlpA disulfide reductase family protein [Corynebacterium sp.]|nr:TlpA disulfide reductase family protein [Corynebacterium sp.]